MTLAQQIITAAVVVLATMLTRFLPFLIFPEGRTPPAAVTYLGTVLPYAVIGLLVVYCLRTPILAFRDLLSGAGETSPAAWGAPEFAAVLAVAALHRWRKNSLLSIGLGTVFYMVLKQTVMG